MHQLKLLPHELTTGMYVAELDRPWTDTHFMFQGFRLEHEDDLRYIREHCTFVIIDVDKGREPARRPPPAASDALAVGTVSPAPGRHRGAQSTPAALPRRVREYPDTTSVEREFAVAGDAYTGVRGAYTDFVNSLRTSRIGNIEPLRETVSDMEASILRNPDAMMLLCHLRTRDAYSYRHAINSSVLAVVFARHLGLRRQQIHDLGVGMMLADVGKVNLPRVVLEAPRRLTGGELRMMQKHVEFSLRVVERSPGLTAGMRAVVANHHERFDGSGYPCGTAGEDIPMLGRIAGIVDTYDAMTNDRVYAKGQTSLSVINELYGLRGTAFQCELVEQFIQALGIYPVGTLVLLSSEEVGVVIGINRFRRLQPKVMLLLDPAKQPLVHNRIIDLSNQEPADGAEPLAIRDSLPPGAFGIDPDDYYL